LLAWYIENHEFGGALIAQISTERAINRQAAAAIKTPLDARLYQEDMARVDAREREVIAGLTGEVVERLQDGKFVAFGYTSPTSNLVPVDPRHWSFLTMDLHRNRAESKQHGLSYAGLRFIDSAHIDELEPALAAHVKRLLQRPAVSEEPAADSTNPSYRAGTPGRPTSRHLVQAELRRRGRAGELKARLSEEAEALRIWLKNTHPDAPQLTKKSIENAFRGEYRKLRAEP
jgi:hypothetical protein